eukprot:TRINITY_DN87297_c0_g1_i1.p1 TRINITY_DN87297_c0_g1~~TRINITY_DN87297_c0_g1_i1.p1  ORF type:complete len:450 (-),score=88.30 TRINITY_DN87297_c0_g1_i1:57-1379(-)
MTAAVDAAGKGLSGADIAESFCKEILSPSFFEEYFERKPLHYRAADRSSGANRLPEALSADDVSNIIAGAGSSLKMFNNNEPSRLGSPWLSYLDGTSMIVNQADRHNKVIFDMCRVLADRHFHHVFAVVYLTPPGSQAVRLHNDDQDVFLFQVWGKKRWTVRNAPQLLCYTEEMLGKDEPVPEHLIEDPVLEFTIEPHDVLYMPRGYLHEASTSSSEPSLHITVTVPTSDFCWGVQLVKHLGNHLRTGGLSSPHHALCKASLAPTGSLGKAALSDEDLDKQIQELLEGWTAKTSGAEILDFFDHRMGRTNEGQERQFKHNAGDPSQRRGPGPGGQHAPARVTERNRVRLMPGVSCRCQPGSEDVLFAREVDGRVLEMQITSTALPLIRSLTATPQWVMDLPCKDSFERLCVLQVLLEQGVLQLFLKGPEEVLDTPDDPLT